MWRVDGTRLVPERDACLGEQGKQWCEALDFLQLEYWNYSSPTVACACAVLDRLSQVNCVSAEVYCSFYHGCQPLKIERIGVTHLLFTFLLCKHILKVRYRDDDDDDLFFWLRNLQL